MNNLRCNMQRQFFVLLAALASIGISKPAFAAIGTIRLCNLSNGTTNTTNGYTTGLSGPKSVPATTCANVIASFPNLTTYSGHFVSSDGYFIMGQRPSVWNCTFYVSTIVSGGKCSVQLSSTLKQVIGVGGGCLVNLASQNNLTCDFSASAYISGP